MAIDAVQANRNIGEKRIELLIGRHLLPSPHSLVPTLPDDKFEIGMLGFVLLATVDEFLFGAHAAQVDAEQLFGVHEHVPVRIGQARIHFFTLRIYGFVRTVFVEDLTLGPYFYNFTVANRDGLVDCIG